jgi:alpha-methylacyl-CoA racemase
MADTPQDQPLSGLKVIEMHAIGPVPFAGMVLRSLGAQVLRVSPPADPGLGVPMKNDHDLLNAGKTPLAADLKSPAGMQLLHEQLASADVLLEGWRPGVLERLGLAPADLLSKYPRLVIGRLSGWGTRGEYADRAGHDINYLALAGVLHAIGPAERPVPPLNVVADFGGGAMHLLLGVLAKLVRRSVSGAGGVAETSILAGTVGLTPMFYGMIASGLWNLKRENNLLDGAPPFYRVYRTRDDRFVSVGALEAKFYAALLQVTGLAGELDPRKQYDRGTWDATSARFAARFAEKTRDEWAALAVTCDCCMAPVLDFAEAAKHPHNLAMGLYADTPIARPDRVIGFPA